MKILILSITCSLFILAAHTQDTTKVKTNTQPSISINVPDFANPETKKFYTDYANHLIKCVEAIRQKDEAKAIKLFKNPGQQLVEKEKIITKEVVKDPAEKQKYMQFAAQVYPYLKEVQQSSYYQKMISGKGQQ